MTAELTQAQAEAARHAMTRERFAEYRDRIEANRVAREAAAQAAWVEVSRENLRRRVESRHGSPLFVASQYAAIAVWVRDFGAAALGGVA